MGWIIFSTLSLLGWVYFSPEAGHFLEALTLASFSNWTVGWWPLQKGFQWRNNNNNNTSSPWTKYYYATINEWSLPKGRPTMSASKIIGILSYSTSSSYHLSFPLVMPWNRLDKIANSVGYIKLSDRRQKTDSIQHFFSTVRLQWRLQTTTKWHSK